MIGMIGKRFFVEFRDEEQLCYALSAYMSRKGSEYCTIAKSDNSTPVCIIENENYLKFPTNLQEETEYSLFLYDKNSTDDKESELIEKVPFIYKVCRVPIEFDH